MKREKQIRQASIEYTIKDKPMCIGGGAFSGIIDEMDRNKAFEEGAKWADKTMIERACFWIQVDAQKYMKAIGGCLYFDVIKAVEDFKKAMNE